MFFSTVFVIDHYHSPTKTAPVYFILCLSKSSRTTRHGFSNFSWASKICYTTVPLMTFLLFGTQQVRFSSAFLLPFI